MKIAALMGGACVLALFLFAKTDFTPTYKAPANACQLSDENLASIKTGRTTLPMVRTLFACEGEVVSRWSANGRTAQDIVFKAWPKQVRVSVDGDVVAYMSW